MKLPAEIYKHHSAVVGKTGAGKTATAKLMVEHVVGEGSRVCILDPIKSDWWGLISSADGKRPGLPFYILGGPHGHVPLHESSGAAIGELVAKGSLPLSIIDMADFRPGGLQKFFTEFAPALLKHMRGVVYLVIEEAHEFAPKERAGLGDENLAIHWAKKLATAGRSKGIRLILVTQRTQSLHNALLGSCETVIAHRLTLPADQKPVFDWLKANLDKETVAEVTGSLASLKTGSGWVCSGEAQIGKLVAFPRITTYDNSATPTGDGTDQTVKTAPVDQDKLRAIIGDAVREAEANDPKALRAEIAKLKREIGQQTAAPDTQALMAEWTKGNEQGFSEGVAAGKREAVNDIIERLGAAEGNLTAAVRNTLAALADDLRAERPAAVARTAAPRPLPPVPVRSARPEVRKSTPNYARGDAQASGGGAELRLLRVLAARDPAKMTEAQWATLAGMKRSGGTWRTYRSRLRTAGYLDEDGGQFKCSPAGLTAAGAVAPIDNADVIAMWKRAVGSGPASMIDVLVSIYPKSIDAAELAARVGMTAAGGTFRTYLSRLRSNGLIEGRGEVRASDHLFG